MAIDEALLSNATPAWPVVMRVYQWERPTLSIGHFQRIEDRELVPGLRDLPWVRRKTGGGAIVHDQELTYSVLMPNCDTQPSKGHNESLYRAAHNAIVENLRTLGWNAQLSESCTCDPRKNEHAEPFLCFLRRSPVDLVVGDDNNKILGSAQRRSRTGLLQHGSFLLRRSQAAVKLNGLLDLPKSFPTCCENGSLSSMPGNKMRRFQGNTASNLGGGSRIESSILELDGWIEFLVSSLKKGVSRLLQVHWRNGKLTDLIDDLDGFTLTGNRFPLQ
ncbi:MAG TPA: hypothetical protein VM260_08030 [Pirellula sp.]|nr:hypothetical protein [Pirellula sp.]